MIFERPRLRRRFGQPEAKMVPSAPPTAILQPTIGEAISKLNKFSDKPGMFAIINMFNNLEVIGEVEPQQLDELWGKLNAIFRNPNNKTIIKDNLSFTEAAYYAMLALAEFKPWNDTCFVTQCEIEEPNRIVVSSREQFDIELLVHYHNTRDYRHTDLDELPNKKWLLNPYTHFKFSPRDVQQLKAFAAQKGKVFENLQEEVSPQSRHITHTFNDGISLSGGVFIDFDSAPSFYNVFSHGPSFFGESKHIPLPDSPIELTMVLPPALSSFEAKSVPLALASADLSGAPSDGPIDLGMEQLYESLSSSLLDAKPLPLASTIYEIITPAQAEQLGMLKTMAVRSLVGFRAISEGLITIEQLIAMSDDRAFLILNRNELVLDGLRDGIISLDQINSLDNRRAEVLNNNSKFFIRALRENLITMAQINTIASMKLIDLFSYTGGGIRALREEQITIDQINSIEYQKLPHVFSDTCFNAIKEHRVTMEQIMEIDRHVFFQQVRDNNFPVISSSFSLGRRG